VSANAKLVADAIAARIAAAGYDWIDAPILQPARVYIDQSGEDLRRRTFIFAAPDGEELCLRPEQTIPVARKYLERQAETGRPARLAYRGPVFRPPPPGSDRPREYEQIGVERFGGADTIAEDAAPIALAAQALAEAGVRRAEIKLGDLGLFNALVDTLDVTPQWRERLKRIFAHPSAFQRLLADMGQPSDQNGRAGLYRAVADLEPGAARSVVRDLLQLAGIRTVGGRTVDEITERFMEKADDTAMAPLSVAAIRSIRAFLEVQGTPRAALDELKEAAGAAGCTIDEALSRAAARFDRLEADGVDLSVATFSAAFGRQFDYYTDFVFEIVSPALGPGAPLSAGGRYDNLLQRLGAPRPTPAVGCMLRPDRIASAAAADGGAP